MTSHTTPFAAILESQPPWWRLGGGGMLVVVAYLGMLLAALSLGGHALPLPAAKPRVNLVVTLLDRPPPVEQPVPAQASGNEGGSSNAAVASRDALPRPTPLTPKSKPKPTTQDKPPSPTPANKPPQTTPPPPSNPPPAAAAVATSDHSPSSATSTAAGTTTATPSGATGPAAARGTATGTGTGTGSGTGAARSGNDVTVLPFTDGMTRPKLIEMVEPQYTREARDANVKGLFLAKCVITTTGALRKCRVVKGLPMMDQAVLSALARWRYTPVIYQGKPVAVDYVIQVRLGGP